MKQGLRIANYNGPCAVLGQDRLWWIFLLSSIVTPFILAFLVLTVRLLIWIEYYRKQTNKSASRISFLRWFSQFQNEIQIPSLTAIRDAADTIVSVRYKAGRILQMAVLLFSVCSVCIYYKTVSFFVKDVEICQPWINNVGQQVDFAFNCFFLVHFILRFLASADRIAMLFNLYSIIDYFTVPPAFVGIVLDRDWIGLKFLRVFYLRRISTLLAYWDIITNPARTKLLQLGLTWIALLLAAGGFFHLVENSGDPFYDDYNGQRVTYWDFCYFAFGTMATIGSPDKNVQTVLGKLTNVFLVLIVLAVIGLALPDIVDMLGTKRKYDGEYRKATDERHLVICGDVSFESVVGLFQEFFHPDRNTHNLKLICLSLVEPDLEFDRFLKKNMFKIAYLQGSFLVAHDLYRAKLHDADACMIMADKSTPNADAEDSSNIMCVVAVKNFNPQLRVIVQLLQYRSKAYLTSIPNWDPTVGDDVVCLPEVKMGLLAQSCVVPGFSTLMANIFASRSSDADPSWPEWLRNYLTGAGNEMYTERLSDAFSAMTYLETLEVCYLKLGLLCFAISEGPENGKAFYSQTFSLNPDASYRIKEGSYGCFLADSAKEVQRVAIYCRLCHDDVSEPEQIKQCACENAGDGVDRRNSTEWVGKFGKSTMGMLNTVNHQLTRMTNSVINGPLLGSLSGRPLLDDTASSTASRNSHIGRSDDVVEEEEELMRMQHEETKTFSSFEKKIVYFMRNFGSLANWRSQGLAPVRDEDGLILDFSDGPRFDSTGLFWWCPPKPYEEVLVDRFQASKLSFKNHVVLIIFANETSSPIGLNNFVMPLRPSSSTYEDLREIVILGDPRFLSLEWSCLVNFPKITMLKVFGLSRADLRAVNIHLCDMCLLLSAPSENVILDALLTDKDPILTSLTIKAMNFGTAVGNYNTAPITSLALQRRGLISDMESDAMMKAAVEEVSAVFPIKPRGTVRGYSIPLLTELINDSNVQFVDQDDFDINEFFMAEPFACGNAFAISVLQALMVSTYFNPFSLSILRALIFGGITPEFEQILAEGAGLIGGPNLSQKQPHGDRCKLTQLSMEDVRFARHAAATYQQLFLDAIRSYNMLVLGLYRKIHSHGINAKANRRYVITNPPKDFPLQPDDRIFVIERVRRTSSW